ncbi:hypothetical protein CAOG_08400 [Capsaspora owczarzaki ATCC 30864]|uniref:SP-RING-type domain-containing protein n=1 Tax=Capsaspora owczarzaki (strain ATCC 30864) TaxID=595528 RepID=A0A0D2VG15_CAPO3|nr:hypothetical protein CAOG_08400 [Capsaspora owczarzaki ATCC 30864]KJE88737.1 hypothetical protein CAOG_008400 [Capsaspora owczarzaki ATCC 30864]|eukprot:XP_011269970.1 hypothetical protein CAOG_08400 [Capsaspora owczarzaki ATCC 30864]
MPSAIGSEEAARSSQPPATETSPRPLSNPIPPARDALSQARSHHTGSQAFGRMTSLAARQAAVARHSRAAAPSTTSTQAAAEVSDRIRSAAIAHSRPSAARPSGASPAPSPGATPSPSRGPQSRSDAARLFASTPWSGSLTADLRRQLVNLSTEAMRTLALETSPGGILQTRTRSGMLEAISRNLDANPGSLATVQRHLGLASSSPSQQAPTRAHRDAVNPAPSTVDLQRARNVLLQSALGLQQQSVPQGPSTFFQALQASSRAPTPDRLGYFSQHAPVYGFESNPFYPCVAERWRNPLFAVHFAAGEAEAKEVVLAPQRTRDIEAIRTLHGDSFRFVLRICPLHKSYTHFKDGRLVFHDAMPQDCEIVLNDTVIKHSCESTAIKHEAFDVTQFLLLPLSKLKLRVSSSRFRSLYVALHFVDVVTPSLLLSKFVAAAQSSVEECELKLSKILHATNGEDISSVDNILPLTCPISKTRIRTAARFANCSHIQCFDLGNFLQVIEHNALLKCPICNNRVPDSVQDYFVIDKFVSNIAAQANQSILQVRIQPVGNRVQWDALLPTDASHQSPAALAFSGSAQSSETNVIDLTDIDDNAPDDTPLVGVSVKLEAPDSPVLVTASSHQQSTSSNSSSLPSPQYFAMPSFVSNPVAETAMRSSSNIPPPAIAPRSIQGGMDVGTGGDHDVAGESADSDENDNELGNDDSQDVQSLSSGSDLDLVGDLQNQLEDDDFAEMSSEDDLFAEASSEDQDASGQSRQSSKRPHLSPESFLEPESDEETNENGSDGPFSMPPHVSRKRARLDEQDEQDIDEN